MPEAIEAVLKLSDKELRQALGKAIFGSVKKVMQKYELDQSAVIKNYDIEFINYKKHIVDVTANDNTKSKAVILIRDIAPFSYYDEKLKVTITESYRSIIVIAERNYNISLKQHLSFVEEIKPIYCDYRIAFFVDGLHSNIAKLLTSDGIEFNIFNLSRKPSTSSEFPETVSFDYAMDSPLYMVIAGNFQGGMYQAQDPLPEFPAILKSGHITENNFMKLGVGWASSYDQKTGKITIRHHNVSFSCIPARNITMNITPKIQEKDLFVTPDTYHPR